jgi:hypothetical protein
LQPFPFADTGEEMGGDFSLHSHRLSKL